MRILLALYVIALGALTSVETGANAKLATTLGGPLWPGVLFSAITVALFAVGAFALGGPFPVGQLGAAPWWAWIGGLVSAGYILAMLTAPQVMGAGLFTGLSVTAAIVASVALDHFGLVGFPVHPAGAFRLLGAALMVAGITLVAIF